MNPPVMSPANRRMLEVASEAARAAAAVHREAAGSIDPSASDEKGRSDFVTEVDMAAERCIVDIILDAFPSHDILAEEGTVERRGDDGDTRETGPGPVRWIIDPLDGTTNWLHGYPEYAVSIAAEDDDGLVVGVVLNSATGEYFDATRGGGARRNGVAIGISTLSDIRLALIGTGFPFKQLHVLDDYLATFSRVLRGTAGIRRAGAAALDLCDVACGRLDAFFEFHLMPWDVAAGALIVREAGGWFEPLEPVSQGGVLRPSKNLQSGGFAAGGWGVRSAFEDLLSGTSSA